jgi:hypothetical protein
MEKPARELTEMYQSKLMGIRLRLPAGWQVKESPGVIEAGGIIKVTVTASEENLADITDGEVAVLAGQGIQLSREREYLNTDTGKMDMTVITYYRELPGGKAETVQKALGKSGQKLIVAEAAVPEVQWGDYDKTLWEIYKNIEII